MAKLETAESRGTRQYKDARGSKLKRIRSTPPSASKLVTTFNATYVKYGYGNHPVVSKKLYNQMKGLIKVIQNEDTYEDYSVYELVIDFVKYWDKIRTVDLCTVNGKPWSLSGSPSLQDLVVCRDSIMAAIKNAKAEAEVKTDDSHYKWTPMGIRR